jgi:hypothetical protein
VPRLQQQTANRRNGRQGFATKSESGYVEQIFRILDFGGGVPLESQQRIIADHGAAIVGDLNQFLASGFDLNLYPIGAGIQRIFQ